MIGEEDHIQSPHGALAEEKSGGYLDNNVDMEEEVSVVMKSIKSYFQSCIQGFLRFDSALGSEAVAMGLPFTTPELQQTQEALREQLIRFRMWAGNVGAHRTGRISLDYRLRESLHIHRQVVQLLEDLEIALKAGQTSISDPMPAGASQSTCVTSSSSGDSEDDDIESSSDGETPGYGEEIPSMSKLEYAILDLTHVIKCLYRFSAVVHQPVPINRIEKCASINVTRYEFWDKKHAVDKFPYAPQFLQDRLARANTKRRQLLQYHERHHKKIAQFIDVVVEPESEPAQSTLQLVGAEDSSMAADMNESVITRARTVLSGTTATTYQAKDGNCDWKVSTEQDDNGSDTGQSQTSYASSYASHMDVFGSRLTIPDPPHLKESDFDGEPFECPYCHDMVPIKNKKSWKRHVFADLMPYVCTFEKCANPDHLYGSRQEWFEHESRIHRWEWWCQACEATFLKRSEMIQHLEDVHNSDPELEGLNYDSVADWCGKPKTSKERCPLCPSKFSQTLEHLQKQHPTEAKGFSIPTAEESKSLQKPEIPDCPFCPIKYDPSQLRRHLGHHLQQMALVTLPRPVNDEVFDGKSDEESARALRDDSETQSEICSDNDMSKIASRDGIRVWAEPEQPQPQPPPRETFTPAHVPRHMPPPPEPPQSAPTRIPNNAPRPPPIHTSFHSNTTPPVPTPSHTTYPFGASPHSYPHPEAPAQGFEKLRLSSDPRFSRDTFHSHSTDNSGDRSARVWRRRDSLHEEEFRFPGGSGGRDADTYMPREDPGRRHHRRRSSSGQHLTPAQVGASHSRQTSEESVFLPAEDIPRPPRRRNSVRERDHSIHPTGYSVPPPYIPTARHAGVAVHQTAYKLEEVTGALGNSRDIRGEGPLPVVWIAVMGVTGSGKSTFIQTATGDRPVGVNHGLRSCTREVEVHSVRIDGFQVNLIDTPGFDDNKRSETEVLQTISTYLAKAYYNQVFLNGIIYIHSIMQTRMGASGLRSLGIMERLTGMHNMDNVLLVSNMWDALKGTVNNDGRRLTGQEVGELREHELRESPEFWKALIEARAQTARHRGGSWESAHEIIRRFLRPDVSAGVGRPMKLLLQEELVDHHKRLAETQVGKYINARLYEGQQQLEKEAGELRRKQQQALDGYATGSSASSSEIGAQLEEKKKGLNDARKNAEILARRVDQLVDEQGNSVTTPVGRTSRTHAGLCNVM